ncbi:serine/threonine protein kinase [Minicystis rosea]|nr:serine/threonine protein kinase [Minicystis rosea]
MRDERTVRAASKGSPEAPPLRSLALTADASRANIRRWARRGRARSRNDAALADPRRCDEGSPGAARPGADGTRAEREPHREARRGHEDRRGAGERARVPRRRGGRVAGRVRSARGWQESVARRGRSAPQGVTASVAGDGRPACGRQVRGGGGGMGQLVLQLHDPCAEPCRPHRPDERGGCPPVHERDEGYRLRLPAADGLEGGVMTGSEERCGSYEILHWLEGAGDVALAHRWDAVDSRRYALKLTDHVDKEVPALDLLAGHPSLPERLGEFRDQERNRWVIVLAWIDGEPLDGARARGMSATQRLWVLHHLAAVLAHVHAAGRVHRDVKPHNVMIEHGFYQDPELPRHVRLIDFDIVAIARTPVTRFGEEAPGTPQYMAPEALRLAPDATNDRARDVFAFGALGWELFANRHPYGEVPPGGIPRDFYARLYAGGPGLTPRGFPAALLPTWGAQVEAVLRACLSPEAEARPEIREVLARLPRVPSEPVRSGPHSLGGVAAASAPIVPPPPPPRPRAQLVWPIVAVGAATVASLLLSRRPAPVEAEPPAASASSPAAAKRLVGMVTITWGPGSGTCPTVEPVLVFGGCASFRDLGWLRDELRALRRKGVGFLPQLSASFTLVPDPNERDGTPNYYLNIYDPPGRRRANIMVQLGKLRITDLTTGRRFWLGHDEAGRWHSGPDAEHLEPVR